MTLTVAHRRRRRHGGGGAARARLRRRLGDLRARAGDLERRSASRRTSRTTTTCRASSRPRRASARSARRRSTCAAATRTSTTREGMPAPPETDAPVVAISSRCMHLGCPVRWTSAAAALHLPVPRRRLRLQRRGRRRSAGAPARPLLHPHAQRPGRGRAALLGQLRPSSASRASAIRASRSTASASTSTPGASRRRRTHETADASQAPGPEALPGQARPARARPRRSSRSSRPRRPASHAADWVDERTSLVRRRPLDVLPQGAEGDQLVLHARLGDDVRVRLAGDHRRVPGDVLHAVADPGLRVGAPHHQRRLPRRVRARHAQVGLVGDGDPDLPAHGRERSSSARTSTRAS